MKLVDYKQKLSPTRELSNSNYFKIQKFQMVKVSEKMWSETFLSELSLKVSEYFGYNFSCDSCKAFCANLCLKLDLKDLNNKSQNVASSTISRKCPKNARLKFFIRKFPKHLSVEV